jgi:hypothetical protein
MNVVSLRSICVNMAVMIEGTYNTSLLGSSQQRFGRRALSSKTRVVRYCGRQLHPSECSNLIPAKYHEL